MFSPPTLGSGARRLYYIATNYPDAAAIIEGNEDGPTVCFGELWHSIPDFEDLPGVPVKIEMDTVRGRVVMTLVAVKRDPRYRTANFLFQRDYTDVKMPDIFGGKNPAG